MAAPVIYKGIAYPFSRGVNSFPASKTDDELIRDSLVQLILTPIGSRVMRPDFGSNVLTFLFEPNNIVLEQTIQAELQAVIAKYEPRVVVTSIRTIRDTEAGEVVITIEYVVTASRKAARAEVTLPTP